MKPTEAQKKKLEELRAAHPKRELELVLAGGREFYLASPTRSQWHRFKEAVADKTRRRVAMENLVKDCAVEPNAVELDELFERKPILAETLGDKVAVIGGADEEAEIADFDKG